MLFNDFNEEILGALYSCKNINTAHIIDIEKAWAVITDYLNTKEIIFSRSDLQSSLKYLINNGPVPIRLLYNNPSDITVYLDLAALEYKIGYPHLGSA
ncbi:MAG: hypothetical protein A2831_03450 [Candidatus Yanofskybacteria bacterium RIFCSPHIGHO2_01_FULL_44_17]|uniref:Uncharacterized protein n=1 Tax=Candidatus Yanofskybacteria bacterium RIFCSPHIGHO2_01_FULL_44_17 TaxID=1802668 RepID=A0A1F8EXH2_9BACT|nr:MAG: hypothetical protein A2831_03450 [Candidatus Yanofskybacteria bacterium RIFCSPHIGHO2_01_FULL_44_17]